MAISRLKGQQCWQALALGITACVALGAVAAADTSALVRASALKQLAVYPQRSIPATVVSLNDSKISAEVRGTISAIPVLVGETVKQGDTLVRLDCRDYELALKRARADIKRASSRRALAKKQLERIESLARQQSTSEELLDQRRTELDVARTDYDLARVQRDKAQLDVNRCTIKAPFDGIVIERLAQVGELAEPGAPMVRLVDRRRLEVSGQVPLDAIAGLRGTQDVWFDNSGSRYPLRLRAIAPLINTRARNSEARFAFAEKSALPGTAGRVTWRAALPHVPAAMVMRRGNDLGVFVLEKGKARFVVLPSASEGQPAATELGLKTMIITEGRYGLSDGAAVELRP
ncbi:MAG: efflux RND transporter periplasmic adaptor subunit [Pseudomonadota bacterium]|nr:MAG: efflux RND transporter periplasmic adaptor subunit [Pseudomonadota bacterium]